LSDRPIVLLIVTDQERHRAWIPDDLQRQLPARARLLAEGMEFDRHYTHSSPCSPSRATLFCGQYVVEHGVNDNVFVDPAQTDLHHETSTIGHLLRTVGYTASFVGKWHLSYGNPDMKAYGFSDWTEEDWAWTGLAGTGTHFDVDIANQATRWLAENAGGTDPWCLVVGLVNPHDVAWYPADQPDYQAEHAALTAHYRSYMPRPIPGVPAIMPYAGEYEKIFDLPANFADDLMSKPAVQRTWRWEENHWHYGQLEPNDLNLWQRALDYYWALHKRSDSHVGEILNALDASGRADDTIVIFTSDHGEMCGSHGMRGKGPFAYEEIMRVPLYVRAPGMTTAGARTQTLSSSVDLASTICGFVRAIDRSSLSGVDLSPLFADPNTAVRDHVLFAQQQGWHRSCVAERFALRGYFDGRHKYIRYYGVGGGCDSVGRGVPWAEEMRFGPDAAFEDQEHELYDLASDPGEVENLAADRSRRTEVLARFHHLLELERSAFTHTRPTGRSKGSTHESGMMENAAPALSEANARDK
jgi:arylsulfatase A-like enzyme